RGFNYHLATRSLAVIRAFPCLYVPADQPALLETTGAGHAGAAGTGIKHYFANGNRGAWRVSRNAGIWRAGVFAGRLAGACQRSVRFKSSQVAFLARLRSVGTGNGAGYLERLYFCGIYVDVGPAPARVLLAHLAIQKDMAL